ncbi:unnamed protein product [Peronospora destructor]|uniref:Uncharacterized protein n=1 Tax=Peronospora destructor TaxID=86335 RepID=A0AAV0TQ05_9STRA|nr:unnamed protein product [Peronospora destructor]
MSFSYRRYHTDLQRLQEQDAEIHRLEQESIDQKRRINELVEQDAEIHRLEQESIDQKRRINELVEQMQLRDEEQERKVAQLRRDLQDQDDEMIEAEQTIQMLIRDVQVAREVASRAEKAQREAEADQMLRHVLRDSDDEGTQSVTEGQLRSELRQMTNAEQQSSHRVSELEQELAVLRDAAEMLSVELQASKNKRHEMELNEVQTIQELEVTKTKADEEIERWKAMANLHQELVATLQIQVKALRSDKDNLENAIALCQRSADKRLQVLERDRNTIKAENAQLLTESTSIRQELEAISLKLREFEEENVGETAELEKELERRLVKAEMHQEQLASRIVKVEQKFVSTTLMTEAADQNQRKESEEQFITEKNELLQQLEEERRQSNELKCSAAMLKKAVESALQELKNVEIELREISGDCSYIDGQHESLVDLAKQVVAEFKRHDGASMEAVVASMQVQCLTSSMHAHLNRLCALREQQKAHFTLPSTSGNDNASESAATSFDIFNNQDGAVDIRAACDERSRSE